MGSPVLGESIGNIREHLSVLFDVSLSKSKIKIDYYNIYMYVYVYSDDMYLM